MPKRKHKSTPPLNYDEAKQFKADCTIYPLLKKVEDMYGVTMPRDMGPFWKMCLKLEPTKPLNAFSILNLQLVGPFYYIYNSTKKEDKPAYQYHMRWRYFYDTPEFLTLITTHKNPDKNLFHIGYFRDNPVSVDGAYFDNFGNNAILTVCGDNLFCAINFQLEESIKKSSGDELKKLKQIQHIVQQYAAKENFSLTISSDIVKARAKKIVANCFHKAGIVIPVVEEIGYRGLNHDNVALKRLFHKVKVAKDDDERLKAFEPIQEIVNYVQFANDECDYGMGLEFGIDLFCYGSKYFHKLSERLLTMAYGLLKMDLYADICKAHFADRRNEDFARSDVFD